MLGRILSFFDNQSDSKTDAKSRLQLILVQDRLKLNAYELKSLRNDMIEVLSKYFVIDDNEVGIELLREKEEVAFVANVPVMNLKRSFKTMST